MRKADGMMVNCICELMTAARRGWVCDNSKSLNY